VRSSSSIIIRDLENLCLVGLFGGVYSGFLPVGCSKSTGFVWLALERPVDTKRLIFVTEAIDRDVWLPSSSSSLIPRLFHSR
jgi:hypothetical protein